MVSQQKKTGILTVQGQQDIVAISFLNGRIVAADALNQTLEEGLAQVLVGRGMLSAAGPRSGDRRAPGRRRPADRPAGRARLRQRAAPARGPAARRPSPAARAAAALAARGTSSSTAATRCRSRRASCRSRSRSCCSTRSPSLAAEAPLERPGGRVPSRAAGGRPVVPASTASAAAQPEPGRRPTPAAAPAAGRWPPPGRGAAGRRAAGSGAAAPAPPPRRRPRRGSCRPIPPDDGRPSEDGGASPPRGARRGCSPPCSPPPCSPPPSAGPDAVLFPFPWQERERRDLGPRSSGGALPQDRPRRQDLLPARRGASPTASQTWSAAGCCALRRPDRPRGAPAPSRRTRRATPCCRSTAAGRSRHRASRGDGRQLPARPRRSSSSRPSTGAAPLVLLD